MRARGEQQSQQYLQDSQKDHGDYYNCRCYHRRHQQHHDHLHHQMNITTMTTCTVNHEKHGQFLDLGIYIYICILYDVV